MSVHGYPADMSIFCNLQLGLLKLREVSSWQADIDQEDVSLAGVLQGAVGSAVWYPHWISPPPRGHCSYWVIIHGFLRRDTIASRGRRFCSSWNRLLCSMLVTFLRARCGWSELFLFIFTNHKLELTSQCLTSDWQLKDCDTFCSMAYIFKGHLNNTRKWLFVFENIID